MAEQQPAKLAPGAQIVLISGVVMGVVIAGLVRSQLGLTGALWGGIFGAIGGGLGALVALPIAGLFKQQK